MTMRLPSLTATPPLVIAHRGASGYRPEHTLMSYALALRLGADVIEPDLVPTRDGVLVARHDRFLSTTTDVASRPEFADRRRSASGEWPADWFVDDFSWSELQQLRARQPFAGRSAAFDGREPIPRFEQILDLADRAARQRGRAVIVYPEIKHPAHFDGVGLDCQALLLDLLRSRGLDHHDAPVWVQCFDLDWLQALRKETRLRLTALVPDRDAKGTPVDWMRAFERSQGCANVLGAAKSLLYRGLVAEAHRAGQAVHAWTFRDDALPAGIEDPVEELIAAYRSGVDAVFADFPDTAMAAREHWLR